MRMCLIPDAWLKQIPPSFQALLKQRARIGCLPAARVGQDDHGGTLHHEYTRGHDVARADQDERRSREIPCRCIIVAPGAGSGRQDAEAYFVHLYVGSDPAEEALTCMRSYNDITYMHCLKDARMCHSGCLEDAIPKHLHQQRVKRVALHDGLHRPPEAHLNERRMLLELRQAESYNIPECRPVESAGRV